MSLNNVSTVGGQDQTEGAKFWLSVFNELNTRVPFGFHGNFIKGQE